MAAKPKLRSLALLSLLLFSPVAVIGRPAPQASSAPASTITQIEILLAGQQTIVRVSGIGSLVSRAERLSGPERLVLDFSATRFALSRSSFPSTLRPVRGVRVGQFKPDVARVVIDLDAATRYSIESEGQSVTVTFAPPAAPAAYQAAPPQQEAAVHTTLSKNDSVAPAPAVHTLAGPPSVAPKPEVSDATTSPALQPEEQKLPNSVENGMLTFHAQDQPLRSILEEIAAKSHVAVIVAEGLGKERISAEFSHYRLDEALRQILQGYDVLFFYGAKTNEKGSAALKMVWVYAANQWPGLNQSPVVASKPSATPIAQTFANLEPNARARAVDVLIRREGRRSVQIVLDALKDPSEKVRDQALASALMMGVAIPEDTLSNLALNDPSPNVRFQALQALPLDPTLRWVAERALNDSSQQVAQLARNIMRDLDAANAPPPSPPAIRPKGQRP